MRYNKGVTVTSLVIYVASFLMIAGVIGVITTFFYNNTEFLSAEATAAAEYDILNVYLVNEAKENGNIIKNPQLNNREPADKIEFSNGDTFQFIKNAEEDKYGAIFFYNSEKNKYFLLSNYIDDAGFTNNGDSFEITITILNKVYTQEYNIGY